MQFIDTHTHLYTPEFDADRAEVVRRAVEAGAEALLLPCIDEASIEPMMQMCADYPHLCYSMIGLHPTELPADPKPVLNRMEHLLEAGTTGVVGIGETGIDLYWDQSRRDEQIEAFRRHAEWSVRFGLPLVVHTRNAHREVVDTLSPMREELTGGVFHCFGGTDEEARELLSFPGFMLGIGGVATFRKSKLPEVLRRSVPLERVVVETDAPYLAPTPHRGQRNESSYIPLIMEKLGEIYGLPVESICSTTTANARRVFKNIG